MTPDQQTALQGLIGRDLTADEVVAIDAIIGHRNDVAVAAILSTGRVKHSATQIGPGTILVAVGDPRGGQFLDAAEALGKLGRTVYWGLEPVRNGYLDLSVPAAVDLLTGLKAKMQDFADDIDKLLLVGVVPDPIHFNIVSDALNAAEGRETL